jgi:outer membrane protein assembly factor BamB
MIRGDSILVDFPEGTNITKLKASVQYIGKTISPDPKSSQDYSSPVKYTVTGDDGSSKTYVVVVRLLSTAKNITSFVFKVADNAAAISKDLVGVIENDTIKLLFPAVISLTNLVPTITHSGKSISPVSNLATNFSNVVNYTVTAQDGSSKMYTVVCIINSAAYFVGSDGYVHALNASTGEEIWKHSFGSAVYSPTVDKDIVYVVGSNGNLYALNAKTGSELWSYPVGGFNCVPMVEDGVVYESGAGYMYEIDAVSGSLLKQIYMSGLNPTLSNKKIYMPRGLNGGLSAIDAGTGNNLWGYGGGFICVSNPAVAQGTVYVGDEFYILSALDANSGALKWRVQRDSDNGGGGGSPTFCNGSVYMVSYNYELFCFDATDGRIKWRKSSLGTIYNPVAYDDIVYVSDPQNLYALDGKTGNEKWRFAAMYNVSFTSCTFANGILYLGDSNGYVYAIDANNGSIRWKYKNAARIATNICVVDVSNNVFHPGDSGQQN